MFKKGSKNADRHLSKLVDAKRIDLKEKEAVLSALQKELKDASQLNTSLIEKNFRLENRYEETLTNYRISKEEKFRLDLLLRQKQQESESLKLNLYKRGEETIRLTSKLMQYKTELKTTKKYYQKFMVVKINNIVNSPAKVSITQITLKRDHNGDFVIEIQEKIGVNLYDIRNIENIYKSSSNEKRFYITIIGEPAPKEFEAAHAEAIIQSITDFITKIKEGKMKL